MEISLLSTIEEDTKDIEISGPTIKTEEHKNYTKTTHDEGDPKLFTLRGSSRDFLEARRARARLIRRSHLQNNYIVVNGTNFKVRNMIDKTYSTEADVETIDEDHLKGVCKLTIYRDNKKKAGKKDQTIMISKKKLEMNQNMLKCYH